MITIISRESPLAKVQVEELMREFSSESFAVQYVKSLGDRDLQSSLMDCSVPADFFTRELDQAVLDGSADIAVHSAKDLPWPLPEGLSVICLLESFDSTDSLVTLDGTQLNDLPQGARIGTSSVSRKAQVLAVRPDIEIVSIRGNIAQRLQYLDRNECDAVIVASCALKRLGITLPAEILPFETHPLQGNLAVTARSDRYDLIDLFSAKDIRNRFGSVTLVGAGPGDPELLTVKAVKAIESADVIYYDALCGDRVLGGTKAECIFVGKRKGEHSLSQNEISELLYRSAMEGRRVVRLKAGDPLLFSRGGEEISYLSERMVTVNVIPGISSFQASAAAVNMPITMRELSRSFTALSGQYETDQPIPAVQGGTSAYFMAVTKLGELKESLLKAGNRPETPAVLVHNCSHPNQQVVKTTIERLESAEIPTPALILVGETAKMAAVRPRLLFTGIDSSRLNFREELVHFPLIETVSRRITGTDLSKYDGILFTSRTAVACFFESHRPSAGQKLFAVGEHTAELIIKNGFTVDFMPEIYDAEHLAPLVNESGCRSVLYPCSNLSKNTLHELESVEPVVFYDTCSPKPESAPSLNLFCGVIFSSPSTVDAFFSIWKEIPETLRFYVYGKSSRSRLLSYGADPLKIFDAELRSERPR